MAEKRIMTDEIRRQLSGLLPFGPGSSIPLIPDPFQKVEEAFRPTLFMRGLAPAVQREVNAKIKARTLDRDDMVKALSDGEDNVRALASWENLLDLGTGQPIPFGKDLIANLPDHTLVWAFDKATELTGMLPLEREGLPSLPIQVSASSPNPAGSAEPSQT